MKLTNMREVDKKAYIYAVYKNLAEREPERLDEYEKDMLKERKRMIGRMLQRQQQERLVSLGLVESHKPAVAKIEELFTFLKTPEEPLLNF